jgi:hypothetical protein
VAQVRGLEEELAVTRRQLDSFDRVYGMGGASPLPSRHSILEKDFECPVCYEVGEGNNSGLVQLFRREHSET